MPTTYLLSVDLKDRHQADQLAKIDAAVNLFEKEEIRH
jgi:hypothetical protein